MPVQSIVLTPFGGLPDDDSIDSITCPSMTTRASRTRPISPIVRPERFPAVDAHVTSVAILSRINVAKRDLLVFYVGQMSKRFYTTSDLLI